MPHKPNPRDGGRNSATRKLNKACRIIPIKEGWFKKQKNVGLFHSVTYLLPVVSSEI